MIQVLVWRLGTVWFSSHIQILIMYGLRVHVFICSLQGSNDDESNEYDTQYILRKTVDV